MAIRIGRWDCTTCGFKGVKGPLTECSNCGADRPKNVKFYLADDSEIVQNPDEIKKAKAGPDWRCSFCSQNNPATTVTCSSCGNTRSKDDKNLAVKDYDLANIPRTGDGTKEKKVYSSTTSQPIKKPTVVARSKSFWDKHYQKILIGFPILIVVIILLLLTKSITVTVEDFSWERVIKVEEYKLVEEEDWSVPSGGTELSSFQAIHHYDQILDHYETRTKTEQRAVGSEEYVCGTTDLGNGYFEDKYCSRTIYESYEVQYEEPVYRDEPVYATKYRYSIYRWKPISPLVTSGENHDPYWANTDHIKANPSYLREAVRKATYEVKVRDDKRIVHRHEIPEIKWTSLKIGDKLPAKRGLIFNDYRGLDL